MSNRLDHERENRELQDEIAVARENLERATESLGRHDPMGGLRLFWSTKSLRWTAISWGIALLVLMCAVAFDWISPDYNALSKGTVQFTLWLFLGVGCALAGYAGLADGLVPVGAGGLTRRSESPFSFWMMTAMYFIMGAGLLAGALATVFAPELLQ